MNHQPFEEWLLSEDSLAPEQEVALTNHLEACPQCTGLDGAWSAVRAEIRRSPAVSPQPGFAVRWEARLEAQRAARQRKLTWLALLVFSLGAIGFSLVVVVEKWNGIPSPIQFLTSLVYSFSSGVNRVEGLFQFLSAVLPPVPLAIPVFLWVGLTSSVLLWAFVWLLGVWRLPKTRRSEIQ